MCGIAGTHGETLEAPEAVLKRMAHRGPDGAEVVHHDVGTLVHTRLAIVDVKGGAQPMRDRTGHRWLVCNGEIYNHETLRGQEPAYPFQTDSDSEVILALYDRWGPEAVRRLDGMFAFALLNERNELLLARDPLGIKPLYYGWANDTLHFASEIKALPDSVEQVEEFPPGHWYTPSAGLVPYYDVVQAATDALAQDDPPPTFRDIRETLTAAVHKRLMSDVPLGVFLSGGLDSSIIAALVARDRDDVHSFGVGMEGSDDPEYARLVARHIGTRHHQYFYTVEEMIAALPEVIYFLESFDPALVRSAVANYFLARLASEEVTVVLSGEGADELYSGYRYLKDLASEDDLNQELVEITAELHNRNLQRLDRMTMAHGLEGRVPFLDVDFIEMSFSVPLEQKLYGDRQIEKWALRKAFEDLLPEEVVWRTKEKFSKGAGSAYVFERVAEELIDDGPFAREQAQILRETGHRIASKEELYYYRIFRQFFDGPMTDLVGQSRSL